MTFSRRLVCAFMVTLSPAVWASSLSPVPGEAAARAPERVVGFSASASLDVLQDWVSLSLTHQVVAADAAAVQRQLKQVLATALDRTRAPAAASQLELSTGALQVSPRYDQAGRMNGWTGHAELILAGRDLAAVSELAGKVPGMTVAQVRWSLSPALRQQTEEQVQAQAVKRFRAKARALTEQFGFKDYTLRDVQVSEDGAGRPVQPLMARAMLASAADGAAVPLEAGRSTVSVSVMGTVQLRP
jgi:predicted secreted protein